MISVKLGIKGDIAGICGSEESSGDDSMMASFQRHIHYIREAYLVVLSIIQLHLYGDGRLLSVYEYIVIAKRNLAIDRFWQSGLIIHVYSGI